MRISIILLSFILVSCGVSEVEQERKGCEKMVYQEYNEAQSKLEELKPSLSYQKKILKDGYIEKRNNVCVRRTSYNTCMEYERVYLPIEHDEQRKKIKQITKEISDTEARLPELKARGDRMFNLLCNDELMELRERTAYIAIEISRSYRQISETKNLEEQQRLEEKIDALEAEREKIEMRIKKLERN
ncbi:hypothetical protein N9M73_06730 [Rhodobacteraceae bacterium]|nr:hypothetical protein [Paracoccaceae bacterium]